MNGSDSVRQDASYIVRQQFKTSLPIKRKSRNRYVTTPIGHITAGI